MSKEKRPETVLEYAVRNGGWVGTMRALTFAVAWAIGEHEQGEPFANVELYGAHWKQSMSTSYREQRSFRKCFPTFDNPRDLFAALNFDAAKLGRDIAMAKLATQTAVFA